MRLLKTSLSLLAVGIVIFSFFVLWSYFNTPRNFLVNPKIITTTTTTQPAEVSFLAVGDIMLSRGVPYKIDQHTSQYPFEKMKETFTEYIASRKFEYQI